MATYAIGDIQGCFSRLQHLLTLIDFRPEQDRLWLAGDLVNRGPESLKTLRFLKNLPNSPIVVLGNHDLHLLALANGTEPLSLHDTLQQILQAPDKEELCAWLRQQKLLHHDATLDFVMVHAGLAPQWDLSLAKQCAQEVEQILQSENYGEFLANMYGNLPKQWRTDLTGWERLRFITNAFTRMRFCDADGCLDLTVKESAEKAPANLMPWYAVPNRRNQHLKIIFGHWAALQGKADGVNVYALDGGCVWGGCLIAMRLEDGQRFQVSC